MVKVKDKNGLVHFYWVFMRMENYIQQQKLGQDLVI